MRVTVCQLDPDAATSGSQLTRLADHVAAASTDFLLLPEMPFSTWLAADPVPDPARWAHAVEAHDRQVDRLAELDVDWVVGTRPIVNDVGSRRNQAFLWRADTDTAAPVREKYHLPDEDGYWEHTWYERGLRSFDTARAGDAIVGIQVCTEMWFMEWARHYAASRVDLLCVPRATPRGSIDTWLAGGRTAAVCSGAYCLSSNLSTTPGVGPDCGGVGWVIDPDGEVLATTSDEEPFVTIDVDLEVARRSKSTYPRYVPE